ncbi:MAG: L-threonylcarbamoyladenylate synthase [Clostridia bacterium]|nr:L-threonylcarbamoyladenylate synthase [Clostridia bacterium]
MNTEVVKITDPSDINIQRMGEIIRRGGLVSFPTETVYGLGASAFSEDAVKKVFVAKGRPGDNPLIVHISDVSELSEIAEDIPEIAYKLFETFSPGPLTVILKKKDSVPMSVTAGLSTVAVRIPSHPIARALIKAAGVPIAAPSSNLSGKPSPTKAEHVISDMTGRIDAIIDGGDSEVGVESTVVEIVSGTVNILRPGGITKSDLLKVADKVEVDKHVTKQVENSEIPRSPGMKYKHYAPDAEVIVFEGDTKLTFEEIKNRLSEEKDITTGVMCYDGFGFDADLVIFMGENNENYAERLFSALRHFDELGIKKVFAQFKDDEEYGMAVKNRLFKSAGGNVTYLGDTKSI